MNLAAVVGVLDEVELIEGCVSHLASIGVQRILLHDRGSTDGTLERAASLARVLPLDIHRSEADEPLDPAIWSRLQLGWAREVGAEWLLLLDADELWLSASGSVGEQLAASRASVVAARRYNVVVTSEEPRLQQHVTAESLERLDLFVEPRTVPDDVELINPDLRWIRGMPMPKVALRPGRVAELTPGHHGARLADGTEATAEVATGLLVAHLPFTTFDRFERKVRNVRETMRRHPDFFVGRRAWHWRRWAGLSAGGLREEFAAQLVSQQELGGLRASGSIRSAAELFRSWAGA